MKSLRDYKLLWFGESRRLLKEEKRGIIKLMTGEKKEEKEIARSSGEAGGRNWRSWWWLVAGLVAVIVGICLFVFLRRSVKAPEITNFEECVERGNQILESYPRQCRTQKGEIFVEEIPVGEGPSPEEICEDLCGDGICQEIVCLGSGCSCAETKESCPEDCHE